MRNSLPLPREAAQELLTRRQARTRLQPFTEYTTPRWRAGKIHRVICEQADRVLRKEIDRLLITCPPQHGKSTTASKRLPALALGHDPSLDVISASATSTLAEEFGREVRNCIASSEYRNLFPNTTLAEDSQAKGRWSTHMGGSYYAIGVGGALMGRGGHLGLIDDPFATWEDGQSQLMRDKVWDWYTGTFYNRIRPGGAIIVIQHRMAEDDLAGRLIEQQNHSGDKWAVVELPALLDDPPWPERYDRVALERLKANTDPRKWSALYMQNPTPEEGTFFKREWFEFVDPNKVTGHKYTTGDFAVTEGDGDYTELATHAYMDNVITLGVAGWRGQTSADVWIERLIDQFATHKPLCFFGESGPIRRSIEPFLLRRMQERANGYCRLEWLVRGHDKATMARPLQAMAAGRRVKIADTEYGHHLLNQLLQFPAGRLDDAVDMAALLPLAIDQAHPAVTQTKPVRPVPIDYDDDDDREEGAWKVA